MDRWAWLTGLGLLPRVRSKDSRESAQPPLPILGRATRNPCSGFKSLAAHPFDLHVRRAGAATGDALAATQIESNCEGS